MLSLVYFFVVLSILILVHELGHFMMAKRVGVRVEKFSFGFGPVLFSFRKKDTEYIISLIPMGGYVKMAGDEAGASRSNAPWEYLSRPVVDRFLIIFAGPFLNYVLAFLIFWGIFMVGSPTLTTEIGSLLKDYPAQKSALAVGDEITAVDGKGVRYWEDMTEIIRKKVEGDLNLTINRKGRVFHVKVRPIVRQARDIFGKKTSIALIGVGPSQKIEKVKYGFFKSAAMSFRKNVDLTLITYKAIWSVLTGAMSVKESMTGPIGIFMITGQAARMGLVYLLHLMGLLSASLAVFNLLPFPVLDGGHIIFLSLEKLRGRPLSTRTQDVITNVGITLLVLLTLFIFYNDIMKFGIPEKLLKLFKH